MGSYVIHVENKPFDLTRTLKSGQVFGWIYTKANHWIGYIQNNITSIYQEGNCLHITSDAIVDQIIDYFDLSTDYTVLETGNLTEYEKRVITENRGVRVLHQDFAEVLLTMLITPRNRIENTERICNRLREAYGIAQVIEDNTHYSFPPPAILQGITEDECREFGMGYRATSFVNAVNWLCKHPEYPEYLNDFSDIKVLDTLKQLSGVGDKVANCIALFALHRLNMFPIDIHIEHILAREFPQGFDKARYNGLAGVMQQYMYYDEAIKNR